jgi:hypothetical protein
MSILPKNWKPIQLDYLDQKAQKLYRIWMKDLILSVTPKTNSSLREGDKYSADGDRLRVVSLYSSPQNQWIPHAKKGIAIRVGKWSFPGRKFKGILPFEHSKPTDFDYEVESGFHLPPYNHPLLQEFRLEIRTLNAQEGWSKQSIGTLVYFLMYEAPTLRESEKRLQLNNFLTFRKPDAYQDLWEKALKKALLLDKLYKGTNLIGIS